MRPPELICVASRDCVRGDIVARLPREAARLRTQPKRVHQVHRIVPDVAVQIQTIESRIRTQPLPLPCVIRTRPEVIEARRDVELFAREEVATSQIVAMVRLVSPELSCRLGQPPFAGCSAPVCSQCSHIDDCRRLRGRRFPLTPCGTLDEDGYTQGPRGKAGSDSPRAARGWGNGSAATPSYRRESELGDDAGRDRGEFVHDFRSPRRALMRAHPPRQGQLLSERELHAQTGVRNQSRRPVTDAAPRRQSSPQRAERTHD